MRINLSEWAINHRALMLFFMGLVVISGLSAYFTLGQNEDPDFTVKTMVIKAYLPGATIQETTRQLTDRLEKKLQETPCLDYIKSYTKPGETIIYVQLLSSAKKKEVSDAWYQVRKKVKDIQYTLPAETVGPFFDDEFGDTYGVIYALVADGFSHRELKDISEGIRTELLRIKDVGKVTSIGAQDEKFYVDFSSRELAKLGITRTQLAAAISGQNALVPSGTVDTKTESIVIETSGKLSTEEEIAAVKVFAHGRGMRVGDIATVRRCLQDPPAPLFRVNGKDALGIAVHMSQGGDILAMGKAVHARMKELLSKLPIGVEGILVANQPAVVTEAVGEFTEALFEAVAIVLVISFLSLGLRAGTVVAFSIPFVLACVFVGMSLCGIDLQRVSLGALIISLGLLVDDAMITVESMVSRLELGWERPKAATYAYISTAFPMLTGTLVTVFGFIPIGMAKSTAGEYTFSLFAVVAISLIISWFVAVLFAPAIGVRVLSENMHLSKSKYGEKVMDAFHRMLLACMRAPKTTVAVTVILFVLSLYGMRFIPQQFFPSSDRPELLVDMTLRQDSSVYKTDELSKKLDAFLAKDPDVDHWTSYVGRGTIRFYLPIDEQLPNDFFTQDVVVAKSPELRDGLHKRIQAFLDNEIPEVVNRISALELGPPVGWPVQFRISASNELDAELGARQVAALLATHPQTQHVFLNWGERQRRLTIKVRQEEARRLSLTSSAIAQAVYSTVTGAAVTQVRDDIYLVDVVLRAREEERRDIECIRHLDIPLPSGGSVPLSVVADCSYEQEYPLVWRRDRLPTVTVQASVRTPALAEGIAKAFVPKMKELEASLNNGCRIEIAGPVEESAKSVTSVIATLPVMLILMLAVLMIQLQNFSHLILVICVAPLGMIGVVIALLVTGKPMGFVALLGIVALIGMIIRNSVILVHQIDMEQQSGKDLWNSVVQASMVRFRPIMLTAVAAILGMLPIAPTIFWGPMANAIMGGLAVATALTLLFLPALYVIWFRVKEPVSSATESQELFILPK